MKRTFLPAIIALATLASCETKHTDNTTTNDNTAVVTPADPAATTTTSTGTTTTTPANVPAADKEWAENAAMGGMMEVMMGQLAQSNASSAEVKKFGQSMVDDHGKANEELKAIAANKGMMLPTELAGEKKAKYDEMAAKKGADFDKAYTAFMVEDHTKDVEEFKKQAANGQDADLKNFASGKVATLEHHLMMAKEAQAKVK